MRASCLVVLIAGCAGSSQAPALQPNLDPEVREELRVPPSLDAELTLPPSSPTGEPVAIALFRPAIGLRRTRVDHQVFTIVEELDQGKLHQQRTETHFELREQVLAVEATAITQLQVSADVATETVELRGSSTVQHPLKGTYVVGGEPTSVLDGLAVTRDDGSKVTRHPQQELSELYLGEVGAPTGVTTLLATRTLRRGETVELTASETKLLDPPGGADAKARVMLVSADKGVATFRVLSIATERSRHGQDEHVHTTRVKSELAIDTATGRILRKTSLMLRVGAGRYRSVRRWDRTYAFDYHDAP